MRLYFVRHAESEGNRLRIFSTRGWKHPLTETGWQQAHALAEALRGRGVGGVVSSPLRRAVETARTVAERLDVPHSIEPALVEFDVGVLEDRGDDEAWDSCAALERRWAAGDLDARLPGGESLRELRHRFGGFIRRRCERSHEGDAALVLVGHGGTFRHGLPVVLAGLTHDLAARGLGNTEWVEAEWRERALRLVHWAGERLEPSPPSADAAPPASGGG